ncbi:MAG: hydroxyacylglutathione hydrolase [Hyphomicrobiaceae bacterium]|nr:hydroxyacylglutathione hydrolase [Hyphomicrobiaceae bacterium]
MAHFEIYQFLCRADNYGIIIRDTKSGKVASIDAPAAQPVLTELHRRKWQLTHILTTHHHADHTDGNLPIKSKTGCQIIGSSKEAEKTPGIDIKLKEGESFLFGSLEITVLGIPGHTSGHIAYWIPDASVVFVGDTLFPMGCGRVFEGTTYEMWQSLKKLCRLPPETKVYCGHEYTVANAMFALMFEPNNIELQARFKKVQALRSQKLLTLPTTLSDELATNPFIRADSPEIRARLNMKTTTTFEVFAELRRLKNAM